MKNKFFEGLEIKQVKHNDPQYSRLDGNWGLFDIRSSMFMPRSFSKSEEGAQDMKKEIEGFLNSNIVSILNLYTNTWTPIDDEYLGHLFIRSWVEINPDIPAIFREKIEELEKKRLDKLKKKKKKTKSKKPKEKVKTFKKILSSNSKIKTDSAKSNIMKPASVKELKLINDKSYVSKSKSKEIKHVVEEKKKRGRPKKDI